MIIAKRTKTCKNTACGSQFIPQRMGQHACCAGCLYILNKDAIRKGQERAERKDTASRKEALKTRQQWLAEAQIAVNAFVRLRDADKPCISCGRFHEGSYDAGHYRVTAVTAIRYHEDNIHRQCVPCNQHKSGNVVEYRIGLLKRIGADRLAFLEGDHPPVKYTIDELKAIKATYKAKLRMLLAERELNAEAA